jgi:hypothetical protein
LSHGVFPDDHPLARICGTLRRVGHPTGEATTAMKCVSLFSEERTSRPNGTTPISRKSLSPVRNSAPAPGHFRMLRVARKRAQGTSCLRLHRLY